jgi:hypothetical protein
MAMGELKTCVTRSEITKWQKEIQYIVVSLNASGMVITYHRANFKTPPFEVCAYLSDFYVRLKF